MLAAVDAPIQRWLRERSGKVILPDDAPSPRVAVLNDIYWDESGLEYRLTVTAFDQFGMVPLAAALGGSSLRLSLPLEAVHAVDAAKFPISFDAKRAAGLDWFTTEKVESNIRVFPSADQIGALGETLATHNHSCCININTAPMTVVEASLRLSGRGGTEQIIANRKAGKAAYIGSQASPSSAVDRIVPTIVVTSTSWSFRIDIHVGPLWRSWWAIYQPSPTDSRWVCVQRLAITE